MSTEAQFFFGDNAFSTANVPTGTDGTLIFYYHSYQILNKGHYLLVPFMYL